MRCGCGCRLVATAVIGACLILLAGVSIPLLDQYIHEQVIKKVAIYNGSETYSMWKEPSVPIYLEVYVFDLKNPSETLKGEKPYLQQKGPYTYREHRKKVNVRHHDNDTVSYKQIKWYEFDRSRSVGSDTEVFTTVNIPLVTFIEYLYWQQGSSTPLIAFLLKQMIGEEVWITRSVKEVVWGYEDRLLKLGTIFDPHTFYTAIAGVMAGKNNTDDGEYTMYTGCKSPSKLGVIDRFNGSRYLPFWTSLYANMVNGTDGSLSPPFLEKEDKLYMFSTDICRSVYGMYSETLLSEHNITLWRFRGPPDVFANVASNPDNAGFCSPAHNCMGNGVLNISQCQMLDGFHVPIVASFPHFHLADKKYQQAVEGLNPHQLDLSVDVDIEPISGIVMHVAKRLQINVFIRGNTENSALQAVQEMVYPVLWVNETGNIDVDHARMVEMELLQPLHVAHITQYCMFGLGVALIIIVKLTAIVMEWKKRRSKKATSKAATTPAQHETMDSPSDSAFQDDEHNDSVDNQSQDQQPLLAGAGDASAS